LAFSRIDLIICAILPFPLVPEIDIIFNLSWGFPVYLLIDEFDLNLGQFHGHEAEATFLGDSLFSLDSSSKVFNSFFFNKIDNKFVIVFLISFLSTI